MKTYEYCVVSSRQLAEIETEINRLGREGFRVVTFTVTAVELSNVVYQPWYALMERERKPEEAGSGVTD